MKPSRSPLCSSAVCATILKSASGRAKVRRSCMSAGSCPMAARNDRFRHFVLCCRKNSFTTNSMHMTKTAFAKKLKQLQQQHAQLVRRKNRSQKNGNGIFDRYENPVLTAGPAPFEGLYVFDHASNPHLMPRLGINCVFNVGAMERNGNIVLMARVEGWDRKSFFAVAESKSGVDNFQFWDYPMRMPELEARSEEHTSELQSRQYLVCR